MANLTLEKFECNGEASSVGCRWEIWKRSLNIYLEAANVQTAKQKLASLLHWGGPELQEIFYNIPGANVVEGEGIDVFKVAVEKLDEYLAPKQSKRFERHIFRQIKQEDNEKFEKFIVRLRQQAAKCQFLDTNDQLIDQITEKCSSEDLRRKILKSGDDVTLDQIIKEANVLEVVSRQIENFGSKERNTLDVNKIDVGSKDKSTMKKIECFRCGSWNHLAHDEKCPAKEKKCHKCERIGHFKAQCKSGNLKRKLEYQSTRKTEEKKPKRSNRGVRNIEEYIDAGRKDEEIHYVF